MTSEVVATGWRPVFEILEVVPDFPLRSEEFVQERLVALADRGHQVNILGSPGDTVLDGEAAFRLGRRLRVIRIRPDDDARVGRARLLAAFCAGMGRDPWYVVRLFRRLRGVYGSSRMFWSELARLLPIAGLRPDVVHFEWLNDATHYLEVLDLIPGAKVARSQGSDLNLSPLVSTRIRDRMAPTIRSLDAVICVSSGLAEIARSFGATPEQLVVLHNGVDTRYFSTDAYPRRRRDDASGLRLITVARLHWIKGHEYALLALRALLDRGHDVHYTIVGGADRDGDHAIRLAVEGLKLGDHVEIVGHGNKARVRALLANADAFLLPSLAEGLSLAMLEAMAMSLPVIVTDVGGATEAVQDGVHGLVIPPRDVDAIVRAAERLLADSAERRTMGEQAAVRVREKFDVSHSLNQLLELFERVVPHSRRVHRPRSTT